MWPIIDWDQEHFIDYVIGSFHKTTEWQNYNQADGQDFLHTVVLTSSMSQRINLGRRTRPIAWP